MKNTKKIGLVLVILGLILLGFSVYFLLNDENSNRMLLTYGIGTAIYSLGLCLIIKI